MGGQGGEEQKIHSTKQVLLQHQKNIMQETYPTPQTLTRLLPPPNEIEKISPPITQPALLLHITIHTTQLNPLSAKSNHSKNQVKYTHDVNHSLSPTFPPPEEARKLIPFIFPPSTS